MHRQTSAKTVPLTRELAEDYATMRAAPGERRLSSVRSNGLLQKFKDGIFHTPTWASAVVGGVRYRVNGQHTSNMLAEMNGEFPTGMPINVVEFVGDDLHDLADLFEQFDARDSARTVGDIVNSHARIHPELDDVSQTVVSRAVSGLAWATEVSKKAGTAARAQLVHSHADFVVWAKPYLNSKLLTRAPVVACIYDTWKRDAADASEFWAMVRDENHADVKHPTRVLAVFLRDSISAERATRSTTKFSGAAFYTKCAHAWNAYRNGGHTQLKCYDTGALPKLV